MATKTRKSDPDYDPIEEALDIGFGLGRSHERERTRPRIEAARRGGQRTGRAEGSKTVERERRERAAKESARREVRRRRREEELASARRGAFASGAAKAKRDAAAEAQRNRPARSQPSRRRSSGGGSTSLTAPTFTVGGGNLSGGLDRGTSARLIVLVVGVSAVGSIAISATQKAPTKTTVKVGADEYITVPSHLRALGGVFVAGTIALVVNEVSPGLGLALALILAFDVGSSLFTGKSSVANRIGTGLFAKTGTAPLSVPHQSGGPTGTTKNVGDRAGPGTTGPGGQHVPGTGIVRK